MRGYVPFGGAFARLDVGTGVSWSRKVNRGNESVWACSPTGSVIENTARRTVFQLAPE